MVNNSQKIILHLCADTGSDSKPYRDAGYNVILIGKDMGVENYGKGRIYEPPQGVFGIIANPVCTDPPYGIGFMGKEWDTFKPEVIKSGVDKSDRKSKSFYLACG